MKISKQLGILEYTVEKNVAINYIYTHNCWLDYTNTDRIMCIIGTSSQVKVYMVFWTL